MRAFGKTLAGDGDVETGFAPEARTISLVITDAAGEAIVYDTAIDHIHHLNRVTTTIWRLCNGHLPVGDLARRATVALGEPIDESVVRVALTKLDDVNLLVGPLPAGLRQGASSRRTLMKRLATASALPVIASMSAPTAAMASSDEQCVNHGGAETGMPCFQGFTCCSGLCARTDGGPLLCL